MENYLWSRRWSCRRNAFPQMSQEYGRSSVCVRSCMSKLYDFVNWRWQNLQMNCFLGREARPGGRNRRRSNVCPADPEPKMEAPEATKAKALGFASDAYKPDDVNAAAVALAGNPSSSPAAWGWAAWARWCGRRMALEREGANKWTEGSSRKASSLRLSSASIRYRGEAIEGMTGWNAEVVASDWCRYEPQERLRTVKSSPAERWDGDTVGSDRGIFEILQCKQMLFLIRAHWIAHIRQYG